MPEDDVMPPVRSDRITIAGRSIGPDNPAFLIAEIGINHNGSIARGRELIDAATAAGADCVKFQMRDLRTTYANGGVAGDCRYDLGSQYVLDSLTAAHLDVSELAQLFDYARTSGVLPLCTPWDCASVEVLETLNMPAYKVASADLTNAELLSRLARTGKPLIVSTGMSDEAEILRATRLLARFRARFALLHCVSAYPPADHEIDLRYLERLSELVAVFGYSSHEHGYAVALAAVALGASIVEKHITLDRGLPGIDHKISLLPDEFTAMVRGVRQVEAALGSAAPRRMRQGERLNRASLGKSLVAAIDLRPGHRVQAAHLAVRSPGNGIAPDRASDLIGRRLTRPVVAGEPFFASDLATHRARRRDYMFRRPWGLPVRFHDVAALAECFRPDFVEFHLSHHDLNEDVATHIAPGQREGLTVHAPDQFAAEEVLDLAATDNGLRARSAERLQRVIDIARELGANYNVTGSVPVVASLGGFSTNTPLPEAERPSAYARVAEALAGLDCAGVEILPQTLPPYPWHFGGRRFAGIFVSTEEIVRFCADYGYRICFDVSHTKLATNAAGTSFEDACECLLPLADLLHLSDAAGEDREGLQIGEGEIDFRDLCARIERLAPSIGFLPEPWQGHHDKGAGFAVSFDRLEPHLGGPPASA